jgi:outer membrane lipoprotein-sorting protein
MKLVFIFFVLVFAFLGTMLANPQPVVAAVSGSEILAKLDSLALRFPAQTYKATMDIYKSGKLRTTMVFSMSMKNLEKQFIHFTAPGDVAGMKIMMEDKDTIYMYSPEFQKVRRVAAHLQNQGFLGSEFTPEDMVMAKLGPNFDATVAGKEGNETKLVLKPKAGFSLSYSKLEIFIDSTVNGVTRLHYFDSAGNHVRTQTREEWKPFEDMKIPTRVRMKNLKTGDETVIKMSEIDVKTAVPDDMFSRRTLMRG